MPVAPDVTPEPALAHADPGGQAGGAPAAAAAANRRPVRRGPIAGLLAALRGDKYMVDAYTSPDGPLKTG
jgi:hypothetical protein